MKHSNISIFVPHVGCPCDCSFCNQKKITGKQKQPTKNDIIEAVEIAVSYNKNMENTELAFFGGSFTAIEKSYRNQLLEVGFELVKKYGLKGIRISTRPDCINKEILQELKNYGVTAIELGAQSMFNEVLNANNRGHSKEDTIKSSLMIKNMGFELGLQMMTGLFASNEEKDFETAKEIVKLRPSTLRLYPTIVFENTKLFELYKTKEYVPQTMEEAVKICSKIIELCQDEKINLIRVGLHATDEVEKAVAGPFHPAFKELCESRLYFQKFLNIIKEKPQKEYVFLVEPKEISKAIGQKKENIIKLQKLGINIQIKPSKNAKKGQFILEEKP